MRRMALVVSTVLILLSTKHITCLAAEMTGANDEALIMDVEMEGTDSSTAASEVELKGTESDLPIVATEIMGNDGNKKQEGKEIKGSSDSGEASEREAKGMEDSHNGDSGDRVADGSDKLRPDGGESSLSGDAAADEALEDDVYVDAIAISPDEQQTCQINMTAFLPEKFGLDCYADIRNTDTHRVYRLSLHPENGYTQLCYVEPGAYVVTNIGVFGDSTGRYDFLFPEDFILSDGEAVDLITMLSNEEEVQSEIDERLGVGGTSSASDGNGFLTIDGKEKGQEFSVETDFEVEHTGGGGGKVGIRGDSSGEYEVSILVVKGGIPGTMTVKYSLDGESGLWSDEIAVPLAGNIALFETSEGGSKKDSGLKAYFAADPRDPDSLFVAGDRYTAYVPDPSTELVMKHKGDGSAVLEVEGIRRGTHAFHLLYDGGYSVKVEVLKGGTFADAVVHVSTDGGKTYGAEMIVPEDGVIRLDDIGIMLCFTGSDSPSLFVTGDIYSVDAVKEDYVPLIIGVSVFLIGVLAVLYGLFRRYMMKQLPGASAYRIEAYTPFAERERAERRLV